MDKIEKFLGLQGVAPEYYNYSGQLTPIPREDRVHLLEACGYNLADEQRLDEYIFDLDARPWQVWLPAATILTAGENQQVEVRLHPDDYHTRFEWFVETEQHEHFNGSFVPAELPEAGNYYIGSVRYFAVRVDLGELPTGYHRLTLRAYDREQQEQLIVAPATCYGFGDENIWGFTCQVYTLRSARNWGIGDFTDLQELISLSAEAGVDLIGINPLHAPLDFSHEQISPYSPSDRQRLDPLYIDPEAEPDFQDNGQLRGNSSTSAWQRRLKELRKSPYVDYIGVSRLKYEVFEEMYRYFRIHHLDAGTPRARDFARFVESQGQPLQQFAALEADRAPSRGLPGDAGLYLYLQWLADNQMENCNQLAMAKGMKIGIMRDLAVGAQGGGAEVRGNLELFHTRVNFGAPADPLGPLGQDWGLPPPSPVVMKRQGYRHFIGLLQANMAHCGALRIDHVMALMRLWWCPQDRPSSHGAYIYYPVKELLALLCLESHRNRCAIVGEDLGVVPDDFRGYLHKAGILSNRVFYFEHYDGWHFKFPWDHEPQAMLMITNHDVPTLAGWWNRADLTLRRKLGLIGSDEELQDQYNQRDGQKNEVFNWLDHQQLLPESWSDRNVHRQLDTTLCSAILQGCARSRSRVLVLQLEDIELTESPVNIPGTSTEYPNWRRKLEHDLNKIFKNNKTGELLRAIDRERIRQ